MLLLKVITVEWNKRCIEITCGALPWYAQLIILVKLTVVSEAGFRQILSAVFDKIDKCIQSHQYKCIWSYQYKCIWSHQYKCIWSHQDKCIRKHQYSLLKSEYGSRNEDRFAFLYIVTPRGAPYNTGSATFLPPLCDHKTGQVAVEGRKEAERLSWLLNGGTQDVQTSPWTPWLPWSFEHVQNSRTKVAEEVGRSQVARRRQEEGTHIAMVAEWMHSGRPLRINLSNASAFLVPPLCLLWPTDSVHWAIAVAATVPPFADHGNPSADLVVQGRHKGRAAAVTQKQNFLGLGNHWASWPFFWSLKGGTKVAALCKGGFNDRHCRLTMPSSRDGVLLTYNLTLSISTCLNTGAWNKKKWLSYMYMYINIFILPMPSVLHCFRPLWV